MRFRIGIASSHIQSGEVPFFILLFNGALPERCGVPPPFSTCPGPDGLTANWLCVEITQLRILNGWCPHLLLLMVAV